MRGEWMVYRRYPADGANENVALCHTKRVAGKELKRQRSGFVRGKGVRHYMRSATKDEVEGWGKWRKR